MLIWGICSSCCEIAWCSAFLCCRGVSGWGIGISGWRFDVVGRAMVFSGGLCLGVSGWLRVGAAVCGMRCRNSRRLSSE